MIIVIGDPTSTGLGPNDYSTPYGKFVRGEVVEAPQQIAEYFLHNGIATVARNWRWPGERSAPKPVPTRFL